MPKILSPEFAADYCAWIVAPVPFLLPWLAHLHYGGESAGAGGLAAAVLAPGSWGSARDRLAANSAMFALCYGSAALLWCAVRALLPRSAAFNPALPPAALVLREAAHSYAGVLVLTCYQLALVRLGAVRPPADDPLLPTAREFALWAALIGLWSDAHFYATHRLLHTPWLYRRVHKLHHRSHNTDPLSGLSMHAAEHALYFSALLPAALPGLGAMVPFWAVQALSVALVVYPIPSHLALWPFERHHWQHHTEFNYNYGSSQLFDELCGTTFGAYAARVAAKKAGGKGAEQGRGVAAADRRRAAEAARQRKLAMEGC